MRTNLFICVLAASCTLAIFAAVSAHFNEPNVLTHLGTWNVLIYFGFAIAAFRSRKSATAQWCLLLFLAPVALISNLYLAQLQLPYLNAPPGQIKSSVGPLLELAIPIVQWPVLGAATLFAWLGSPAVAEQ